LKVEEDMDLEEHADLESKLLESIDIGTPTPTPKYYFFIVKNSCPNKNK
jgi:hypothetical protein